MELNEVFRMRMTAREKGRLERRADRLNLSASEYVRGLVEDDLIEESRDWHEREV